MTPETVRLPDGRVWLRVAKADWSDPLDPSFARTRGGRWNSPGSFDTLYLSGDVDTARAQVRRMLEGSPVAEEDLDDGAPFLLVAATLPTRQRAADAVTDGGLSTCGLPITYPRKPSGKPVPRSDCQPVGLAVHGLGLRGVWSRSAAVPDGSGRELAWFPARRSSRATAVWKKALPYGVWRHARSWADVRLDSQPDPG